MPSAKVNWQFTEKDQFVGYSQWSLKQKPFRGLSATIPAESIRAQDSWTWLHKAEWQRVWNDRSVLEHLGCALRLRLADGSRRGSWLADRSPNRPARIDTASAVTSAVPAGSRSRSTATSRTRPVSSTTTFLMPREATTSSLVGTGRSTVVSSVGTRTRARSVIVTTRNLGPAPPTSQDEGQLGMPKTRSTSSTFRRSTTIATVTRTSTCRTSGRINDRATLTSRCPLRPPEPVLPRLGADAAPGRPGLRRLLPGRYVPGPARRVVGEPRSSLSVSRTTSRVAARPS